MFCHTLYTYTFFWFKFPHYVEALWTWDIEHSQPPYERFVFCANKTHGNNLPGEMEIQQMWGKVYNKGGAGEVVPTSENLFQNFFCVPMWKQPERHQ